MQIYALERLKILEISGSILESHPPPTGRIAGDSATCSLLGREPGLRSAAERQSDCLIWLSAVRAALGEKLFFWSPSSSIVDDPGARVMAVRSLTPTFALLSVASLQETNTKAKGCPLPGSRVMTFGKTMIKAPKPFGGDPKHWPAMAANRPKVGSLAPHDQMILAVSYITRTT